jgi:putative chitobiose transport system permease protein
VRRDRPHEPTRLVRLGVLTPMAALAAFLFLLPLLWMIASAVRPAEEIFRYLSPLTFHAIVPDAFSLESFRTLLAGPFPRSVLNLLIVAGVTVVCGLLICAMAAFGLSVPRYRLRNFLFMVVVVSFLAPFDAIAIPLSELFRDWQLDNSYAGLILPGLGNGLAIFLLRQFFLGIPIELREAAIVDGAGWWTIFWSIYLRLSTPALVAAGLILFVFQWQAYLWPLLIISDQNLDVAPVALAKYLGQFDFDFGQTFAGAVIIAAIPVAILLLLQRYFTQSIARTGIKD